MRAPTSPEISLARQAREHFVARLEPSLEPLTDAMRSRLSELVDMATGARDAHDRRDALTDFDRQRRAWQEGTARAWRKAMQAPAETTRVRWEAMNLELIGDEVVENKILASRLAQSISDKASWDLGELTTRMTYLEGSKELATHDVLRPDVVAQLMVEQWGAAGLGRTAWGSVQDVVHRGLVEAAVQAYKAANAFLVERGVVPDINLASRVRRVAAPRRAGGAGPAPEADAAQGGSTTDGGGNWSGGGWSGAGSGGASGGAGIGSAPGGGAVSGGASGGGASGGGGNGGGGNGGGAFGGGGPGGGGNGGGAGSGGIGGGVSGGGGAGGGASGGGGIGGAPGGAFTGGAAAPMTRGTGGPSPAGASGASSAGSAESSYTPPTRGLGAGVGDETRMMTSSTPLARARMRASGVIGQLKRLLTDRVGFNPDRPAAAPSPGLAAAIQQQATQVQTEVQTQAAGSTLQEVVVYDDADVERAAVDLRERTGELKKKASTATEKATIEIVALMFQSILAEERIPAAVRVWFARLQMPVLRVALAEPEFFGTLQHPARQLIDRMGSCVLGFNAATIGGTALELEIKRVVQVIEQYPETGRRVFQLVYDEFQKFLAKFLTEKGDTQRLVSVAQQVEQKETMAIQYTIELRKMLNDLPVRDEIREFLFKVWAEVLAMAAIKHGPQHAETVALKKSAADLVWSASAKPNRGDRARVIQDLPQLLQRLRTGMTLLGLDAAEQEKHIKVIGDTLADAFMSKTESIPQAQIEAMTKRLANLEDFVSDESTADLPLDADSIELMLGIDASKIEVVADGGSSPSDAMVAWTRELQQGTWFTLDHNGKTHQVQYVWRSDRGQLHLFASAEGKSYLLQAKRLAAYLQAGLLLPAEEEALTVRATRDALAKLDANPERLLA